jgi:hypothetical protein
VHEEVGVQLAHAHRACCQALAACRLDQPSGVVAQRVTEHRAGVRLSGWLRGRPCLQQTAHLRLHGIARPRLEEQCRPDDEDSGAAETGLAIVEPQVLVPARQRVKPAPAEHLDPLDQCPDVPAVADARVRLQRAAYGARDPDRELEAAEVMLGRRTRQRRQHDRRACRHPLPVELHAAAGAPQRHHERVEALVRDQEVGAAAQHPHRQVGVPCPEHQQLELHEVLRRGEVARGTTDAQVGVTRQRHALEYFDARGRWRNSHIAMVGQDVRLHRGPAVRCSFASQHSRLNAVLTDRVAWRAQGAPH